MEHASEHHAAPVGRTYVLARFETGEALVEACHKVREKGFEPSTPTRPTRSTAVTRRWASAGAAFPASPSAAVSPAMFGGYLMMVYMNSVNWPLNVGGRPPHAPPSFIPITFETTVLLASLSIFFGLLALMRLPQPYHAVFESEQFRSAVNDGFWLSVAAPPGGDGKDATARCVSQLGGREVSTVQEDVR